MPITPLHFGINGTISSIFSSKLDITSCILANILLDVQPFLVIFFGLNIELHGVSHSLFFGIIASFLFFTLYGIAISKIFHSKKPLSTFIFGGISGAILHIIVDSFYHSDVKPFYPFSNINFAYLGLANKMVWFGLVGYITFFIVLMIKFYVNKNNDIFKIKF